MKTSAVLACLAAVASALPSGPFKTTKRQANPEAAAGLTDLDILNFALTLEWLEATFYQDGIAQLGAEAFTALGLSAEQVNGLVEVGNTEFAHASFLQGAIAQGGASPVQPCEYSFPFTDAAGMIQLAAILENVGVGAYLGAAQLVSDASILTAAGSILTVEARHQTLARTIQAQIPVPQPFDAPLTPRMALSLAVPFIVSCPEGSNLAIEPFPTLTQVQPAAGEPAVIGAQMVFQSDNLAQATHCAFLSGGLQPGGAAFSTLDGSGACTIPQNIAGISYVALVNAAPLDGIVVESSIMAGPLAIVVS
ncbi:related to stress response protein rds1p [Cephalotrichum gorgonifer]|uniref:Related to stress response protein rds1p n=1 Tax=Cephalotrichum gorgonifer TaxID=2041049 RepID=A0AAE8MQU6_9PEZI|nr:related to stress response protein rds1p [Cephalotrichum gorgonifer]